MAKVTGIGPASFAEDGGILDLSLTEVVSLFLDKEKHRHRDAREDENQQEDMVGCRAVPTAVVRLARPGAPPEVPRSGSAPAGAVERSGAPG